MYNKLCFLNTNKAHGEDGMASFMLKELSNEIKGVLAVIYSKSMAENKFPMTGRVPM